MGVVFFSPERLPLPLLHKCKLFQLPHFLEKNLAGVKSQDFTLSFAVL